MLPEPIKNFIKSFSSIPSIGPRQAMRLAFYITNSGKSEIYKLAKAIADLHQLKTCPKCFFTNSGSCIICNDENRRKDIVCIIEKETDLISLEKTQKYKGVYLVLGEMARTGALDASHKLKLNSLKNKNVSEVILGISPTAYGELNISLIIQEIKLFVSKITKLGRGIPIGGEIEFADPDTLGSAIDNRS